MQLLYFGHQISLLSFKRFILNFFLFKLTVKLSDTLFIRVLYLLMLTKNALLQLMRAH